MDVREQLVGVSFVHHVNPGYSSNQAWQQASLPAIDFLSKTRP